MEELRWNLAHEWIRGEMDRCIPFWLEHGMDPVNGGVYTCLDRRGEVYSTDKSVWMQGRCAWMYSWISGIYGPRREWLDAAESCISFMDRFCFNPDAPGRMYFTVTKEGKPLRQRRYFYSEAFYASACAEYYGVTGEKRYLENARAAYDMYWNLWHGMPDPAGLGPKTIPETRTGRAFGLPMIYLNVCSILLRVDPEHREEYEARSQACVDEIFRYFVHPELRCVLESTGPDGEARLDVTEGRVVNPGHDIEGVWFLLEHAKRTGQKELVPKAEEIFKWAWDLGWDYEYGGLLYFVDCLGRPPEAYEHDMKLWWPHDEILIASMMLYRDTGKAEYLEKFYKTLEYCKAHFSDPEYGEWYGYLRRDGRPTMPSTKGSTFKGPFHLPRMLVMVDRMMTELEENR